MSKDSEKKEAYSEENPIDYGRARYIGGHILYPKSEDIGVYFYNDRFSIWFTERESWLRIPLSNIVRMENFNEKKHIYTKIQFKENSGEQYVVIDFEKGIEIAQNLIYNKMRELKENTTPHEHSEPSQPTPSIVEQPKPSIVEHLPYKSPGTAALIAFIGGIFGLPGIGHMYVGKVGNGIGILILGLILYAVVMIMATAGLASLGYSESAGSAAAGVIGLLLILSIVYIVFFLWQIFNARKMAKKFNETVRTTGNEPW